MSDERDGPELLGSKRAATRYRVLVEIAETVGVTVQAVSEQFGDPVESGYVDRQGRGRYEVTVEGIDWLVSRTDALEAYVGYLSENVIRSRVDTARITEGDRVALSMADGVLTATPSAGDDPTDDGGGSDGRQGAAGTGRREPCRRHRDPPRVCRESGVRRGGRDGGGGHASGGGRGAGPTVRDGRRRRGGGDEGVGRTARRGRRPCVGTHRLRDSAVEYELVETA
ncbi:MAG: hypothetical protein J07HB67_00028 [halophilic archaeon J07HB67]|jgi:Predicted transcriptional regulator|nr:MAG: hypothetical protein J07HB67_00028 [halophilic archaeon J07HB67]